jgi:hypothetical protein
MSGAEPGMCQLLENGVKWGKLKIHRILFLLNKRRSDCKKYVIIDLNNKNRYLFGFFSIFAVLK